MITGDVHSRSERHEWKIPVTLFRLARIRVLMKSPLQLRNSLEGHDDRRADPLPSLAATNQRIVTPGWIQPVVRLKDGSVVQTGTVAAMLHNVARSHAGERLAVEAELEIAIPAVITVGLFDLFPVDEWIAVPIPVTAPLA